MQLGQQTKVCLGLHNSSSLYKITNFKIPSKLDLSDDVKLINEREEALVGQPNTLYKKWRKQIRSTYYVLHGIVRDKPCTWTCSSAGQSNRLIIWRSQVQTLAGPQEGRGIGIPSKRRVVGMGILNTNQVYCMWYSFFRYISSVGRAIDF